MLADEFFRLSHDESQGTALLAGPTLAIGMAASLIGELVLLKRVKVTDKVIVDRGDIPEDALTHMILDRILAERDNHPVPRWLNALAFDAVERVAQRLVKQGHVQVVESRRLLRSPLVTYVPTREGKEAAQPGVALRYKLRRQSPLTADEVLLGGLALTTQLHTHVLAREPAASRQYLNYLVSTMPDSMQHLLTHTRSAVGAVVLTNRF